jgi:pimeloyl-ACP methyl ester carboxylesterase
MWGDIENAAGETLDYSYTENTAGDDAGIVVIGHGVTGNKDRPWARTLAAVLSEAGFATLRLSFSGNGGSGGRFVDSCPTKESGDLAAVLDVVHGRPITYVGHSMGAAVGVLRAAVDPRITRLVSLAGMVDTHAFVERKFADLTPDEDCMWALPECPYSRSFLDDMTGVGSVAPLAARIDVPWLLVHGTADTVVPISESRRIAALAGDRARLHEITGCDHVFSDGFAAVMAREVLAWLR